MSKEYQECAYNLWTGFVGKATCEAGYLRCDGLSCPLYTPKKDTPKTNYDLLISKTPEELVEWIESIEPAACPWRDDHGDNCRFTHCHDCWISWLKSPVEPVEVDNGL